MNNLDIKFIIQDQEFFVPDNYSELNEFTITSTPSPYRVLWNDNIDPWEDVNKILKNNPKNLLFIDKNIYELYKNKIKVSPDNVHIIEATEQLKTLESCMSVVDFLQEHSFTKSERLVVVGGGVIQDIGAFVGAVFKRGIHWVFFPTTLLAMCDSCIGGKTGINYKGAKNQLALFSAPTQVVINSNFLRTLPKQELKAGLGEIIKLHITGGSKLLDRYESMIINGEVSSFSNYKSLIIGSLMVKKAIIEIDEFELNLRRSLNYGHTLGHAIESMTDFSISHGQAVAIGIVLVDELSYRKNTLSGQENSRIQKLCLDLMDDEAISIVKNLKIDSLVGLLKKDKKTMGGMVNLILLRHIGDTIFLPIPLDDSFIREVKSIILEVFN